MLSGISIKWLPFLVFTVLQGNIAHRYFSEQTCENLLLGQTIKISGSLKERAWIQSAVNDVNTMVGPLSIDRLKINAVSSHKAQRSFLLFGRLFAGTADLETEPEKTRTVFVHELGHAIFQAAFQVQLGGLQLSYFGFLNLLAKNGSAEMHRLMGLIYAYNEIFADLVTILDARDPNVIPRAHGFVSSEDLGLIDQALSDEQLAEHKYRFLDFTAKLNLAEWDKFMKKKSDHPQLEIFRRYAQLAPVRGILWQKYAKDTPRDRIPHLLSLFIKTAGDHLAMVSLFPELTYTELNNSFLNMLDRNLAGPLL